ncbi:MAG: hypothetical protein JST12_01895 [Armatimonadetes bacterium]|nr:hypothetical protein [Armatimonadota bacterium]
MIPELESLRDKLASREQTGRIRIDSESDEAFAIVPTIEDTFTINVSYSDGTYQIAVGPWYGQFEDIQSASAVTCWLLTPYYRIATSYTQDQPIASWLEIYTDAGWESTEYVYFEDSDSIESPVDNADKIVILTQAVFLDSSFTAYHPAAHLDGAGYPLGTIIGETTYEMREDGWYPTGVPIAD